MKEKMVNVDRLVVPDWMKEDQKTTPTLSAVALEIIGCVVIFASIFAMWIMSSVWTGGI